MRKKPKSMDFFSSTPLTSSNKSNESATDIAQALRERTSLPHGQILELSSVLAGESEGDIILHNPDGTVKTYRSALEDEETLRILEEVNAEREAKGETVDIFNV
jgi:hypothetical protein